MLAHMTPKLRNVAVALLFPLALVACGDGTTTTDSAAPGDGPVLEGMTRDQPLQVGTIEVPAVEPDGTEVPFRFAPDPGRLLYVYFGYTHCPDLCPTTFADFKAALARLDPDEADRIDVAFVTVDPDRDTPEIMNGYLAHFVERGTSVRVTDPTLLEAAEDLFGASSTVKTNADGVIEVSHTAISYVVNPDGEVVVEWPFGFKSEAMAGDLRILLTNLDKESQ